MVRVFGRGIKSSALDWNSGVVGLTEIKIAIPENLEEPVASEPLVEQVAQTFATITPQQVAAIAKMATGRGE
jgi:hypothetical protein